MEKILRYTDDKSDKFWRIETLGVEFVTNWGKVGASGRYQIFEFENEEKCEKKAKTLIAQKMKKGYKDYNDFNKYEHFYFDDEEWGLHQLTSNPVFREYFSNDLYYDCGDEEAPFGSDEGSDTFHFLEEKIRKKRKINFVDFPKHLIEADWELTYIEPDDNQTDADLIAQAKSKISDLPGDQEILQSDQVILATAFGQIKITGKLDDKLMELAFKSLNRMERLYRLVFDYKDEATPYGIKIMRDDLIKFKNSK